MSFQQGLSGLNATSKNLDVIGNNVANANTYGAKSSRAEFADMYANALNGGTNNSIGIGVNVAAVAQQFTQGNITTTGSSMRPGDQRRRLLPGQRRRDDRATRATASSRSTRTATSSPAAA